MGNIAMTVGKQVLIGVIQVGLAAGLRALADAIEKNRKGK